VLVDAERDREMLKWQEEGNVSEGSAFPFCLLDFGVWSFIPDYLSIRKVLNANQPDARGSDQRGASVRFVFFLVALDLARGVVVDDDTYILFAKRQMAKLVDEKEERMINNTQGLSYCMNYFRE
jgi:hypothetical protein